MKLLTNNIFWIKIVSLMILVFLFSCNVRKVETYHIEHTRSFIAGVDTSMIEKYADTNVFLEKKNANKAFKIYNTKVLSNQNTEEFDRLKWSYKSKIIFYKKEKIIDVLILNEHNTIYIKSRDKVIVDKELYNILYKLCITK